MATAFIVIPGVRRLFFDCLTAQVRKPGFDIPLGNHIEHPVVGLPAVHALLAARPMKRQYSVHDSLRVGVDDNHEPIAQMVALRTICFQFQREPLSHPLLAAARTGRGDPLV
jgi:hypothetical protein